MAVPAATLPACGDKDGDTGTSDGGASDGGTSDGGTSDGGTSDGGSGDGGSGTDAAFWATGTYDGEAFEMACNFTEEEGYRSSLQCQDGIQIFVTCRLEESHGAVAGIEPDKFQVWLYLHSEYSTVGTHEIVAGSTGVCVGDNMGTPLCPNWGGEYASGSITVDAITLWTAASGSFEASWAETGEHWATVTGGFDLACD